MRTSVVRTSGALNAGAFHADSPGGLRTPSGYQARADRGGVAGRGAPIPLRRGCRKGGDRTARAPVPRLERGVPPKERAIKYTVNFNLLYFRIRYITVR